jgi:dihydroorotase
MRRTEYELLLKGGEIVSPAQPGRARCDVAFAEGRVAAIEESIPTEWAEDVIDVSGKIVTPGLIDLHTHVYAGQQPLGIEADPVARRSGVTTFVDAGSTGAANFAPFRKYVIEGARSRVVAFLNLSAIGLTAINLSPEHANPLYLNTARAIEMAEANQDVIVGIKVRVYNTDVGIIWRARAVADAVSLPLMIHIGYGPPSLRDIVANLEEGDILTHCFTAYSHCILTEDRKVRREIREAVDRGAILDTGHGLDSFGFSVARDAIADGLLPDVISTDLHALNINGPVHDLPTTLSKFLALGLSLEEVLYRATLAPAHAVGLGSLAEGVHVGGPGDVAVFELVEGKFEYGDSYGDTLVGRQKLVHALTVREGKPLMASV